MNAISLTTFKRSDGVKNYIVRWDDDSISVRTLWLTDKRIKGIKLRTKKFGKYLHEHTSQRFSKETVSLLQSILQQEIGKEWYTKQTEN